MAKNLYTPLIIFLAALFYSTPSIAQVDWVGNMFPGAGSSNMTDTGTPLNIYVQTYQAGVTEPAGQGAGITCEIYFSEVVNFGDVWASPSSVAMTYNIDIGNNDEYQGAITAGPGNYEFTCRCSDDAGANWTYVDLGGAGNGQLVIIGAAPVELATFTATPRENNVVLDWRTESEINSDYFELQKSRDAQRWEVIDRQNSTGSLHQSKDYSYLDEEVLSGKNYYRLNMVDFDGSQEYSEVLALDFRVAEDVKVYPNPAKNEIYFETDLSSFEQVAIYNTNGQLMRSQLIDGEDQQIRFDISSLNSGIYFYQLIGKGNTSPVQNHFFKN